MMKFSDLSLIEQRAIMVTRLRLTQRQLAKYFGVSTAFFCLWMKGERRSPKLDKGVRTLYLNLCTSGKRRRIHVVNIAHGRKPAPAKVF